MADLYTSYETSLALRDAGAPQGDGSDHHWRVPGEFDVPPFAPWLGTYRSRTADVRAFRADEIIVALVARGSMELEFLDDGVVVWMWNRSCVSGPSLVEALATAYLSVLKEGK